MIHRCKGSKQVNPGLKIFLIVLLLFFLLLAILFGSFLYVTLYRYTDIAIQTSPDERCQLTLQMKGEPRGLFGSTYGRIIAQYDGEIIRKIEFQLYDDGAMLQAGHWKVAFGLAGAEVTLMGSEQPDQILQILYDGSDEFTGYSTEQITEEMTRRYGTVTMQGQEGDLLFYDIGEFSFCVQNTLTLPDNYQAEYYRYLTDAYFAGRNRHHEYEEIGEGADKTYTLMVTLNGFASEEKEWFCSDLVNWLLALTEYLPYEGNEAIYQNIQMVYQGQSFVCPLVKVQDFSKDNIAEVYNGIYDVVEYVWEENYEKLQSTGINNSHNADNGDNTGSNSDVGSNNSDTDSNNQEEMMQWYLSIEPNCSYETDSGMEYRMIPVDQACGSSYYVLIATEDGGNTVAMINTDPYLGSGGNAQWICFLEEEKLGFSCLAYSGGTYGSLYRTEDGGRSFEEVEYPSAKAKLSDGTYYNPFVMPEKVYEQDGKLYLEVGQGPEGDYYGTEGYCHALYESEDRGKTWKYVEEITIKQ